MNKKIKLYQRRKNKTNVRAKISSKKYRCLINRSNKFIYAQLIEQENGKIIFAVSDLQTKKGTKIESAKNVGKILGIFLKKAKIDSVVFDRNGFLYHGRVASLCDGIREEGVLI